jgi:hypothetical protein
MRLIAAKQGQLQASTKTTVDLEDKNNLINYIDDVRGKNSTKKLNKPSPNVQYKTYRIWTKLKESIIKCKL